MQCQVKSSCIFKPSRILWLQLQLSGTYLEDVSISGGACQDAKIPKNAGFERRSCTGLADNLGEVSSHISIDSPHLLHIWPSAQAYKSVAEFAKNPLNSSVVDVDVRPAKVAQRLVDPVAVSFENEPMVPSRRRFFPGNNHAELKWHIEARGNRRPSIQFNTGKIMQ